jgi:hypothetical protein
MFIMVYLALRKHRDLNSTLLTIFYRDGVFYFVILSGTSASRSTTLSRANPRIP